MQRALGWMCEIADRKSDMGFSFLGILLCFSLLVAG
ncbi:MAG: hypothetical protein HW374_2050, partial [Bacteroidetes bacterium]|nr:hypothetical protein [Bacteroidota bacterium]